MPTSFLKKTNKKKDMLSKNITFKYQLIEFFARF